MAPSLHFTKAFLSVNWDSTLAAVMSTNSEVYAMSYLRSLPSLDGIAAGERLLAGHERSTFYAVARTFLRRFQRR